MPGSQELKEDFEFNVELSDLLEVMKNIAVVQYRSLHNKRERFQKFAERLHGFFRMLDVNHVPHRFISPKIEKPAFFMITSNEGFMGDLNFQVVDAALGRAGKADAAFFVVGESGERYLKDGGKNVIAFRSVGDAEGRRELAKEIKEQITRGILEDRFGRVTIFFPAPVSFMFQKVEAVELFPLTDLFPKTEAVEDRAGVILESEPGGIIDYLAEAFIEHKLIEILEDSKLSEFAARAVRLEQSGRELEDKKKHLRRQYLHALHELVDKNTRELFSSQIIIKHKDTDAVKHGEDGHERGN